MGHKNRPPTCQLIISSNSNVDLKTKVHFIDKVTRVDRRYYHETLLQNCLLPDIHQLCGGEFVFQQDVAPSHRAKLTVEFLQQNVTNFIEPYVWPPYRPEINSIMLSGVLCSKMCTEFQSWVWRISKTKCVPAGPVSINN